MKKKERIELKERLNEHFIKDFNLEDLKDEEKELFINIAIDSNIIYEKMKHSHTASDFTIALLLAAANIQNFHILKALKDNNDKLNTTIQQNNQILELLTKLIEKNK